MSQNNESIGNFVAQIKIEADTKGAEKAEKATEKVANTTHKLNTATIQNGKITQQVSKILDTQAKISEKDGKIMKETTKTITILNDKKQKEKELRKQEITQKLQEQEINEKRNQTLKTANITMRTIITSMSLMTAASMGVFYGANKFTMGVANWTRDLEALSMQTGISVKEFERWGRAGEIATKGRLNAQNVYSEMAKLQKQITDISLYGADATAFIRLGIDPRNKDSITVMDELRNKIQQLKQDGKSNMQITSLIGGVIDPEMIPLLTKTRKEFDLIANHKMLSAQQRADLDYYRQSWQKLGFEFKTLKDQTAATLSPVLERFNTRLSNFLLKNGDKIAKIVAKLTHYFLLFGDGILDAFEAMGKFISNSSTMGSGLSGILIAVAGIAAYLNPLTALGIALTALVTDIAGFKAGKESLFNWEWLQKFTEGAIPGVLALGSAVKSLTKDITELMKEITLNDKFKYLMQSIGQLLGMIGRTVGAGLYVVQGAGQFAIAKTAGEGVENAAGIRGKHTQKAFDKFKEASNLIQQNRRVLFSTEEAELAKEQQLINQNKKPQTANPALPNLTNTINKLESPQLFGGSIANYPPSSQKNITNNNSYEINVNGTNLPADEIARAIQDEIAKTHQQVQYNLQTI